MTAISFSLGSKHKLELEPSLLSELVPYEFVDRRDARNTLRLRESIAGLTKARLKVDSCVDERLKGRFQSDVCSIVDYLLCDDTSRHATTDVFANSTNSNEKLRTAAVTCCYAEVGRFLDLCDEALQQKNNAHVIRVVADSTVNSIIDAIRQFDEDHHCVIVVEQVESLSKNFLTSLVSLGYHVRFRVYVSLLLCISTNTSVFSSHCTLDSLDLLDIKIYNIDLSVNICSDIMKIVSQLEFNDVIPLRFAGDFLLRLRLWFEVGDLSALELRKNLIFAISHHFLERPLWMFENTKQFDECVEDYNALLDFLTISNEDVSRDLHREIQEDRDLFWKDNHIVVEWRHRLRQLSIELLEVEAQRVLQLLKQRPKLGESLCQRLESKIQGLKSAVDKKSMNGECLASSLKVLELDIRSKPLTPSRQKSGISAADYKRRMQKMQDDRENDETHFAMQGLVSELDNVFKSTLVSWRTFLHSDKRLIGGASCASRICTHDNYSQYIEDVLLKDDAALTPVSLLMRTIFSLQSWKNIRVGELAHEFALKCPAQKSGSCRFDPISVFYAALGQLELMGIVKCGSDRKYPTVTALYHPIYFMP